MSAKVQHYNQVVDGHKSQQTLNPFSSQCPTGPTGRRSPRLELSASEYGKPKSGSLTEMRGFKANMQVFKDILELCEVISIEGKPYNKEGFRMIFFGDLFQVSYFSEKIKHVDAELRPLKIAHVGVECDKHMYV